MLSVYGLGFRISLRILGLGVLWYGALVLGSGVNPAPADLPKHVVWIFQAMQSVIKAFPSSKKPGALNPQL